jgi:hypothetical protein
MHASCGACWGQAIVALGVAQPSCPAAAAQVHIEYELVDAPPQVLLLTPLLFLFSCP